MTIAYRFSYEKPELDDRVHAFRELKDLKEFVEMQGGIGSQKFWKLQGNIESDDGGKDGIEIKVSSVEEIIF